MVQRPVLLCRSVQCSSYVVRCWGVAVGEAPPALLLQLAPHGDLLQLLHQLPNTGGDALRTLPLQVLPPPPNWLS